MDESFPVNTRLGEVVIYQPNDTVKVEVRIDGNMVWLNRQQLSQLFGRDVKTIGKHIANALKEELAGRSVVAKFATTAADGKVYQVEHYNLDMIISVGYRVKSARGIDFRIWAREILSDHLLRGYSVSRRLQTIDFRLDNLEQRMDNAEKGIDIIVNTPCRPKEGIFFAGQIFDAYMFVSQLIRSASKSILLIDNYVDDTVLALLDKRNQRTAAVIYTAKITPQLKLDLRKHNAQYLPIEIKEIKNVHDRFLIIDNNDVYHIGASLKDLGKKLFAFSKLELPSDMITSLLP